MRFSSKTGNLEETESSENGVQDALGAGVPVPLLAGGVGFGAQFFVEVGLGEEAVEAIGKSLEISGRGFEETARIVGAQAGQIEAHAGEPDGEGLGGGHAADVVNGGVDDNFGGFDDAIFFNAVHEANEFNVFLEAEFVAFGADFGVEVAGADDGEVSIGFFGEEKFPDVEEFHRALLPMEAADIDGVVDFFGRLGDAAGDREVHAAEDSADGIGRAAQVNKDAAIFFGGAEDHFGLFEEALDDRLLRRSIGREDESGAGLAGEPLRRHEVNANDEGDLGEAMLQAQGRATVGHEFGGGDDEVFFVCGEMHLRGVAQADKGLGGPENEASVFLVFVGGPEDVADVFQAVVGAELVRAFAAVNGDFVVAAPAACALDHDTVAAAGGNRRWDDVVGQPVDVHSGSNQERRQAGGLKPSEGRGSSILLARFRIGFKMSKLRATDNRQSRWKLVSNVIDPTIEGIRMLSSVRTQIKFQHGKTE